MLRRNHRPKYVSDATRPPLNVPPARRVHRLPPAGNTGHLSGTRKHPAPMGLSPGPGFLAFPGPALHSLGQVMGGRHPHR